MTTRRRFLAQFAAAAAIPLLRRFPIRSPAEYADWPHGMRECLATSSLHVLSAGAYESWNTHIEVPNG